MRAAVLHNYRQDPVIEDVPFPACPEDGVVLRVLACGVCRSDWHGWVGEHPRIKPGAIGGHEYCGEVVERGPRSRWQIGDTVVAPFILSCGSCPTCASGESHTCPNQRLPGFTEPGAFAEYVAVPHDHNLARLPDGMSPVLAAGLGKRMRPQSADKPKPLVPVLGRTLLDRVLDRLAEGGVEQAVVNVHYLGEQIIEAVAGRRVPAITISDERGALLDTGGGVAKALPLLGDGPFFVQNADSIWIEGPENSLERMRAYWDSERMDCLLLLACEVASVA